MKETALSLFLTAPIEGLMQGIYQAHTDMTALKKRGDFGIGTFNNLDGEMIVNLSGQGPAVEQVDEQDLAGDPRAGNGGTPQTSYSSTPRSSVSTKACPRRTHDWPWPAEEIS